MNNETIIQLRERILQKIKEGKVHMRPRWQFVLKSILMVGASLFLTLALLYVASLVVFVAHQNGTWFAPSFGWDGVYMLLTHLPWMLVGIAVIVVVALELFVTHYSFAYRRPLLYSLVGIMVIMLLGGFAVAQTSLHRRFFMRAEEGRLPIAGPLYRGLGSSRFHDVHPGRIETITEDGFTFRTRHGESLSVVVTSKTRLPFGFDFTEGDLVVIIGDRDDDPIQAKGVLEVQEGMMMGPGMMRVPPPGFQRKFKPNFRMMK